MAAILANKRKNAGLWKKA